MSFLRRARAWCIAGLTATCSQGVVLAEPLEIVATTGMVADIAQHVAGDRSTVVNLLGEGVDPHLYKPVASDVRQMMAADVILYNGLHLEGRMEDVFERAAARGRFVRPVAAMVDESFLMEAEDDEGHVDPHVWMDVKAWIKATEAVALALCQADPEGCEEYRVNAAAYIGQLQQLDRYVRRVINSIPMDQRVLVTAHDAFGYFGRAYGVEVMAVQGVSTESEAGLAEINALVNTLVERKIPAVFIESSISPKYIRALVEGAAARGHELIIGGELYSDAMGPAGTWQGTYIGMMDHNAGVLATALQGKVPDGGFRAVRDRLRE